MTLSWVGSRVLAPSRRGVDTTAPGQPPPGSPGVVYPPASCPLTGGPQADLDQVALTDGEPRPCSGVCGTGGEHRLAASAATTEDKGQEAGGPRPVLRPTLTFRERQASVQLGARPPALRSQPRDLGQALDFPLPPSLPPREEGSTCVASGTTRGTLGCVPAGVAGQTCRLP